MGGRDLLNTLRWSDDRACAVSDAWTRAFLVDQGMPTLAILFEADPQPSEVFSTDAGDEILRIGSFDGDFDFFLNVDTGEVLFGMDRDPDPVFANTSLSAFVACLRWVDAKFPFYSSPDDTSVKLAAGQRVREFLRSVDPACVEAPEGFWKSFVHDVESGDYYEGSF
ncbi:SUKH-4 family immunity protein [Streptomyces sp. NPDC000229]|uniref:SUKH-4 family immunity protein n=1 Tax=Streptomyces sp. NPDC000229 TaxID=3154247 RepID=UPI00331C738A